MEFSIKTGEGLERFIEIKIPHSEVKEAVESRIKKLQPTLKVPGFRAGKVSERVVKQQYGASIQQEVATELSTKALTEAIKKAELKPMTQPQIEFVNLGTNGPLEYVASFEIEPVFELASLDGLHYSKYTAEVTDEKVTEAIEGIRKQQGKWEIVDRSSRLKDRLTIDFEGSIAGDVFEGGKAEKYQLELGLGRMIPGFEEGLVGLKAGDESVLEVPFPHDYGSAELAGRLAQFAIKVHDVSELILPELSEEFVANLGFKEGGIDALSQFVRKRLQAELNERVAELKKQQVLKEMSNRNEFQVPKGLVKSEIAHLKEQKQRFAKRLGISELPLNDEDFRSEAEQRVKLGLLVNRYATEFGIEADQEEVLKMVQASAANYENPSQVVNWYYQDPQRLLNFVAADIEKKVIEHILEKGHAETQHLSYDELMKESSA